jgi:hypothetical protein
MRVLRGVEAEQHPPVGGDDILEAQRFRTRAQRSAKSNAVQQCAKRAVEASRTAVFDPATLVFKTMQPLRNALIAIAVRLQRSEKVYAVEQAPKLGEIHRLVA